MDGAVTECAAFDETVVFLSHFKDLRDPRQQGKVSYPLEEILLLCLLAVLAGAECFTEIELFGVKKLEFLRLSARSRTARRTMVTSAISWPCSMPGSSSAALLPGSPR